MSGDHNAPAPDTDTGADSDSQMIQCVECGQFFAARDDTDELMPLSGQSGGRCSSCGGDEFERVTLDSDSD